MQALQCVWACTLTNACKVWLDGLAGLGWSVMGRDGRIINFLAKTLVHAQIVSVTHYLFIQPSEQGNAEGLPATSSQQMPL